MEIIQTHIPEVKLIKPQVHGDHRGWFIEAWQQKRYQAAGLPEFVQDNIALSQHGILRGLHIQHPHGQGKLVQVLMGEVFDVAVDVRRGSPWFGQWVGYFLSADNHHQLWIPPGFAHGYMVTSNQALFAYKCTDFYHPETEFSLLWKDPMINIDWPIVGEPILSEKDAQAALLKDQMDRLPDYLPE